MAISELQLALIGAGVTGVAMVWGYNVWQDRQHRKTADRIFKGGQGDALMPGQPAAAQPTDERQEPHIAAPPDEHGERGDGDVDAMSPGSAAAVAEEAAAVPLAALPLPADDADAIVDCVLRLDAAEAVAAPAVLAIQHAWAGDLSRPLRWLAQDEDAGGWVRIDAESEGSFRRWAACLQLVDRRGPVGEGELARFFDGVQALAAQIGASVELPVRSEVANHAAALDEFCAAVDLQFVLHVVDATGGAFVGTKLRGVAEAAGLMLESDGVFRARDEAGGEMYTVANLGPERLDAESLRTLATHGITLSIDVPRVSDGVAAFDRMLASARQLTTALGGVLVDAQRAPLSEAMIAAIRAKIGELQQRMQDADIVPGSTRALRLFS